MPLSTPARQIFVLSGGAAAGHSPADSTTYTFGAQPGINPGAGDGVWAIVLPRPGRVTRCSGIFVVLGTTSSAENITVNVRNQTTTTNAAVTTTLTGGAVVNSFSNTALSLSFSANDGISIQFVTPAWVTNPTATTWSATIEVEFTG